MDQLIGQTIFMIIILVILSLANRDQQQVPNPLIIKSRETNAVGSKKLYDKDIKKSRELS